MAKATYLLRKASELVREKRYQDAVEVYLRATEAAPSDSRAWFGLGVCLFRVGNLDVSRIALQRARHMGYPRAEEALARVEGAERRRQEEGLGAKATVAPAEAEKRAAQRPAVRQEPPPRPAVRPADQKIELVRPLRVMLVEERERDRQLIARSIEGTLKDVDVVPVPYGVSTSETMSGTVHYDAAVLDWDGSPDATAGLIQILKIKRPTLFVICLTEDWDPETAVEILEAGADYHLVKNPHFASVLPLLLAQWSDRDYAVAAEQSQYVEKRSQGRPDVLDAIGEMLLMVDADGTILHANPAALRGFSRGEEQMVGQSYFEALYGEDEPPESCPIARALEHEQAADGTIRHPELDKAFAVDAWPVRSPKGTVTGAVALLREHLPAEEALAEPLEAAPSGPDPVDVISAGVVLIGPEGTISYVNPGLCIMLDQSAEDMVGRPFQSVVSVEDHESLSECLAAIELGGRASERINLQRADGSALPTEARIVRSVAGEQSILAVSLIDVSELERAEQELWSEASRSAGILDDGVDRLACVVVVLDDAGRIVWANTAAAQLLEIEKEALDGRDYLDTIEQALRARLDDADSFLGALSASHENGTALDDFPLTVGGEAYSYRSTPVEGETSLVSRVEQFYVGTQHAPGAAPVLQTGAVSLTEIAAALPDMLFTTDAEGRITWCSRACSAVSGYGEGGLVGMPLANLSPDEERGRLDELLRGTLRDGRRVDRQEVLIVRADGRRRWAELTLLPARANETMEPQGTEGILRDITERKMTDAIRAILDGEQLP
jgi:PAS domain S-box-containing protein